MSFLLVAAEIISMGSCPSTSTSRAARHVLRDSSSGANGKQALVGAVFARLDVLGFQRLEYELTPDAIDLGLDAALPAVIELESEIGEFGRGERI
jgi:hypothetical protein